MSNIIGQNAVGSLMHASRNTNPLNKIGAPDGWKHIDTKFGLSTGEAEVHRKALQMAHGVAVKKLIANFHLQEWHFMAKLTTSKLLKK